MLLRVFRREKQSESKVLFPPVFNLCSMDEGLSLFSWLHDFLQASQQGARVHGTLREGRHSLG